MTKQKSLFIAISLTSVILIVEIVGGFLSNSLALLSDAGHMLVDFLALMMALVAVRLATRPATNKQTFGYYRFEVLAALFNGVLLVLVSVYIAYEAVLRLFSPEPISGSITLVVAIIGLIANLISMAVIRKTGLGSHEGHNHEDDINLRGAFWHILSDALTSVGVIIAAIVILLTGWLYIDAIISLIIVVLIMRGAVKLIIDSGEILLESAPKNIDLDEVKQEIEKFGKIKCVHDLHIWTITSGKYALAGHVQIEDIKISETDKLIEDIRKMLEDKFQIEHATIQFEFNKCYGNECRICKQ
ncbi:cation diffusion facilitator family transporter [Patescibacteria group bacterium]|nr:cation diffusion facilitator family transporter [Patescibacteria group bacterium]